jgi:hypothetical protein
MRRPRATRCWWRAPLGATPFSSLRKAARLAPRFSTTASITSPPPMSRARPRRAAQDRVPLLGVISRLDPRARPPPAFAAPSPGRATASVASTVGPPARRPARSRSPSSRAHDADGPHRPCHPAGRFSRKARMPSTLSACRASACEASRSPEMSSALRPAAMTAFFRPADRQRARRAIWSRVPPRAAPPALCPPGREAPGSAVVRVPMTSPSKDHYATLPTPRPAPCALRPSGLRA